MKKTKIEKIIKSLEKDRLSLVGIFLCVILISFLRGYLEVNCYQGQLYGVFGVGLITNDLMCGLSAFIGGTMLISFFGKVKIKKVMNACVLGWIIFLTPPLFDYIFFGGCDISGYTFVYPEDIARDPLPAVLFFPLFIVKTSAPGLVFQAFMVFSLSFLYVLLKTKSKKRLIAFIFCLYLFGHIEGQRPFIYSFISNLVLELKLLPAAYESYFFLFMTWSFLILLMNRKFASKLFKNLELPFFFSITILVGFGMLLTSPRFFNLIDFFLKAFLALFLWLPLTIFSNFRLNGKIGIKEKIKNLFIEKSGKYLPNKRYFELAINLQILSVIIGLIYFGVKNSISILSIVSIGIFSSYLFLIYRKIWFLEPFFFGSIGCLSFLLGYSSKLTNLSILLNTKLLFWVLIVFLSYSFILLILKKRKRFTK